MENYFFLKNYDTSEGAVSHQQFSVTRHQVVSTAFNYRRQRFIPILKEIALKLLNNDINEQRY